MIDYQDFSQPVVNVFAGVFGVLGLASLITRHLIKSRPEKDYTELKDRIRSWWVIVALFAVAVLLQDTASLVFFGLVSFLALKEFFSVIPTRRADRRVLFWAYLSIPLQYYWVADHWYGMFIIFIPVYMFLLIPVRMVLIGETEGFLRSVGIIHWGMMTTVFALSHMAFMLVLDSSEAPAGGAGLLLFLVIMTQFNDVAQYVWGKNLGRRKVLPTVSPNKTVEGLAGGVLTSAVIALGLAPYLTPARGWEALAVGGCISLAGFFGDVVISSIKRDLKIKDTGATLPGHGGVLDRVDSLIFTAPLFFHYVRYFH